MTEENLSQSYGSALCNAVDHGQRITRVAGYDDRFVLRNPNEYLFA